MSASSQYIWLRNDITISNRAV